MPASPASPASPAYLTRISHPAQAEWNSFPSRRCSMVALDPNDADHFIYTKPPTTYQSKDGGRTFESLHLSLIHI